MRNIVYWGLGVLIVLFLCAFVLVMVNQHAENQQLEADLAEAQKKLEAHNKAEDTPQVVDISDVKPPDEPGFKWVRHGDHWDKVPVNAPSKQGNATPLNTEAYGITRQGTRYLKNPAWADRAEAHTIPIGPPLEIDWYTWANLDTWFPLDWYDPRTWEAYRNFWGFDRPHVNPDGTVPWRTVLDNWGTPLQQFRDVSLVVKYSKRIGFRPTPEQFAKHQALVVHYADAQALGDTTTAESLRSQIVKLEASAQGELPNPNSYFSTLYGDPYPDWESLSDDERRRINKEQEAVGIKNLYKRLGIEHLYEYYEKPKF